MLALVFASSCVQEEFGQNESDEAVGTLSVTLPDVVTKVYGDGMYDAKNLIIGVFDENGVEKFRKNLVWEKDVFSQEFKIQFVMGKKYQMVLWAQYGNAYGVPKDMPLDEITLDYKASNREDLDAFYAYVPVFTVTQDFSKSITLKRPFAQLNFATTVGDMDESIAAGDLGIHNKAAVTIKNVANTLNLFTGKTSYVAADGTETAAGVEVLIPETEFPKVDGKYPTITVEEETYEVISMNYVLVADANAADGKTTVDLKLKVGELEIDVPNAYMKRNWRTNVIGELLTGEGTFKVSIDPIFDGTFNENWNDGTSSEEGEEVVNAFAAATSEKNADKVAAKGGKYYVDVTSNVAWTVSVPQGLKAEPASGKEDAQVVVTVPENTTEKDVTYEVVVKTTADVDTKEYKFNIVQEAAAPVVPDQPDPDQPTDSWATAAVAVNGADATDDARLKELRAYADADYLYVRLTATRETPFGADCLDFYFADGEGETPVWWGWTTTGTDVYYQEHKNELNTETGELTKMRWYPVEGDRIYIEDYTNDTTAADVVVWTMKFPREYVDVYKSSTDTVHISFILWNGWDSYWAIPSRGSEMLEVTLP